MFREERKRTVRISTVKEGPVRASRLGRQVRGAGGWGGWLLVISAKPGQATLQCEGLSRAAQEANVQRRSDNRFVIDGERTPVQVGEKR